jgi:hypothetical protein
MMWPDLVGCANARSSASLKPAGWGWGGLDRVLFVGGGTSLAKHISNWFPTSLASIRLANARGMLKYLRYVCEASDAA